MGELAIFDQKDGSDSLIRRLFTDEFDDEKAKMYFEMVHYPAEKVFPNYSSLTEYVYFHYEEVKRPEDGNTEEVYWQKNLGVLQNYLDKNISDYDPENKKEILELPHKLSEDIELAIIQYKHFFEELTKAKDKLETVNMEYKKASGRLDESAANFDNSSSNFISMLGVFSALIFGVFGGFDAFKSIFSNINKASVTMVIINSSILMIGLIILIFLLIQSISILSGKTFLACGCENTSECSHEFYERYPLFSFSISLFLFILVLGLVYGAVYRAGVKTPYNLDLKQLLFYMGVVFLGVVIGFLPVKICKNIKKRNKDSLRKNEKSTD